jgi:hypothetical protein
MVRLSKNFTLQEYTKSQTALRQGIDNDCSDIHRHYAKLLFRNVVQPVRDNFGVTVVNSGYRSPALNKAIGGSATSQHCKGQAVDIECPGVSNFDVAKYIEQNLDFDQLILEFYTPGVPDSGWVHVSYNPDGNRKSVLTAMKENGKTVYKTGLIQ